MHSCDIKRTAIALLVLFVATRVSTTFTGCEGADFVSKQCAEDGETIAPLLMEDIAEHEPSKGAAKVQQKNVPETNTASVKHVQDRQGLNDRREEVLQDLKPKKSSSKDDKSIQQSTSTIKDSLEAQRKVDSLPEAKKTLKTLSSDKQHKNTPPTEPATSSPSSKVTKKLKQEIKQETSVTSSAEQSNKPYQSFTQKLHNTVTKINKPSNPTTTVVPNPAKDEAIKKRDVRSLPATDLNKVSQSSSTSNNLKNQSSNKQTTGKSAHSKVTEEHDQNTQNTVTITPSKTTGDKLRLRSIDASKKQASQVEARLSSNKKPVSADSPQKVSKQSVTISKSTEMAQPSDKSKNKEKDKGSKSLAGTFSVKSSSSTYADTGESIKNSVKNRFRRSLPEEKPAITKVTPSSASVITKTISEIVPHSGASARFSKAVDEKVLRDRFGRSIHEDEELAITKIASSSPASAVTETLSEAIASTPSEAVAEQGFTELPDKFDFLSSTQFPVDELAKSIKIEKPALLLAIETKNDNVADQVIDRSNLKDEHLSPAEKDLPVDPVPQAQKMTMNEDSEVEETASSEPTVAPETSFPPKAESLVADVQHPAVAEDLKTNPTSTDLSTGLETLPSPVAIRMDGIDHDLEYGEYGYEDRVRPTQKPVPKLAFPDVPQGESFHIQDLGLSEGLFVFSYLSSFLSWIQPYDFPVELLRDALWKRVSVVDLITESLQVEVGFIVCLTVGVLLALGVPCILLVHACCRMFDSKSSSDGWNEQEVQAENCAGNCRRVTLVFIMQLVLVLLVVGIVSMFVTNEQMSHAVEQTPTAVHTALNDVTTFLRNSHQQLRFVVTKTLDQAVDAIYTDLDNIEELLGRPIQEQIATSTGVDIALDALVDVSAEARGISSKVEALMSNAASARDLIVESRERLADLRLQVDLFRRQCPSRFRPLCDTVDPAGLDVVLRLESLMTEQRLTRVRDLRDGNLTLVAQQARGEFQFVPMRVEKETKDTRNAIKRQLARQKEALYDSAWSLDVVSRDLSYRVEEARNKVMQIVRGVGDVEQWRWLTGLGAASAVLFLWLILLAGVTCGCCGVEGRAGSTLLASVVLMSIFSVGLWALALSALLVGGHGEVFVCRPLYDEPGYSALTRLVDRPGVLFQRSSGGFFSNLLYGNGTLDVPLRDVLEECQADGPAYRAFRLNQVFDVDSASDHRRWDTLHAELRHLRVDLSDMKLVTPELQEQLQEMLMATTVNLTNYRSQISRKVTGRDLGSFADQLTSVANQITDLSTLSRIEALSSRTRRLLLSHIQPLEQRKEDLVYQLTALEVQMGPLQRQVNQSISHLKTIQFFIDNQARNISTQKSEEYVARLVGYMDQFRDHVLNATKNFVAPCRPIWNLYHAMRVLFCRHVMDPLNGFWFATVWCLLLFLIATPPSLKLVDHYRHMKMQHQHNSSLLNANTERQLMHMKEKVAMNRSPSETLMITDQGGNWSTPGSGEPDGW